MLPESSEQVVRINSKKNELGKRWFKWKEKVEWESNGNIKWKLERKVEWENGIRKIDREIVEYK